MRLPDQMVASPDSRSIPSIPASRERSRRVPFVAHNGAKECAAPATRTVFPRRAAATTAARSSGMDLGVTSTLGVARTFPAQFVQVPLAFAQAATSRPHPHGEL